MQKLITLLLFFTSIPSFSQLNFEKAYFVTNSDQRIECFVKNSDWMNNPNSFKYKLNEGDNIKVIDLKDVKIVEIYNRAKFIKSTVKVDKSSNNMNQLSTSRNPEFVEEQVFLKQLVTGNVNLFKFSDGKITQYFYQVENNTIEPLIYKAYETEDSKVAFNEEYKRQIEKVLVCPSITTQEILKLKYKEKNLTDFFIKYYKCLNSSYEAKAVKIDIGKFNLNIRPRINFTSAELANLEPTPNSQTKTETERKLGFSLGLEAEYAFPFNRNKWAIIVEPTYQSFETENTIDVNFLVGGKQITSFNYKSIEVPLGIRYYMFINKKSKVFINAQYVFDFEMKSTVEFRRIDNSIFSSYEIESTPNFAIGFGYHFNNKYGIEARYFNDRNITDNLSIWQSKYKNISLILSYSLF